MAANPEKVEVPHEYLCPITLGLMSDPVVAADNFSYERTAIENWLNQGKKTSPKTGEPLAHSQLVSNATLKILIFDFRQKHPSLVLSSPRAKQEVNKQAQQASQEAESLRLTQEIKQKVESLLQKPSVTEEIAFEKQQTIARKLLELQKRVLEDKYIQEELATYIPANGIYRPSDHESFDLEKALLKFLSEDKKSVFLLRGEAGTGKSTFNRFLERELWKHYKAGDAIPLFISLPNMQHVEGGLINEHLHNLGFLDEELELLKKQYRFTFILDGYDEINRLINLHHVNHLGDWQAKTIIACRPSYLNKVAGNYNMFFMPFVHERPQASALEDVIVAPFTDEQIESYIRKYLSVYKDDPEKTISWSEPKDYLRHLDEVTGLRNLIRTPFLLMVTMDVLPRIVEQYAEQEQDKRKELTQAALLDAFVDQLFERHEYRLMLKGQLPGDGRDVKQEFLDFAMDLAVYMCDKEIFQVRYVASKKAHPLDKFFGTPENAKKAEELARARGGCLSILRTVDKNCYAFIHNLLRDYLKGRKIKIEEEEAIEEEVAVELSNRVASHTFKAEDEGKAGSGLHFGYGKPFGSKLEQGESSSSSYSKSAKHN